MPKNIYLETMSRIKKAGNGKIVSANRVVSLVQHMQAELESIDRKMNKLIKVLKDEDEDYLEQLMDWRDEFSNIAACVHTLVYDIERDSTALRFSSDDEDIDDVVDLEEADEEVSDEEEPDSDDLEFIAPEGEVSAEEEETYDEPTESISDDDDE